MARIYAPRQRQTDGRWDYTVASDEEGWVHPLGYCAGPWKPLEAGIALNAEQCAEYNLKHAPFAERYHVTGHTTAEDARACYRQYELDHLLRFYDDPPDATTFHRCQAHGCEGLTAGLAECGEFKYWHLCALHRNRETVEVLWTEGYGPKEDKV